MYAGLGASAALAACWRSDSMSHLAASQLRRPVRAGRQRRVARRLQLRDVGLGPGDVAVHLALVVAADADVEDRLVLVDQRQEFGAVVVCCHGFMVACRPSG